MQCLIREGSTFILSAVSRVNLQTGIYEPAYQETNEKALIRVAQILSRERKVREMRSPHGKAIAASNSNLWISRLTRRLGMVNG
ncbi:PREDICTED: patatin-like protein 2 [Prunus mume]|uniref:Patatin-like protein 2 n=1 Tax=Prunus mume TaxID=102107 RepID=A0ABM1LHV3_PRUMU|nr:PREDICTED: patatin-like protein 2 [Prunus mume]